MHHLHSSITSLKGTEKCADLPVDSMILKFRVPTPFMKTGKFVKMKIKFHIGNKHFEIFVLNLIICYESESVFYNEEVISKYTVHVRQSVSKHLRDSCSELLHAKMLDEMSCIESVTFNQSLLAPWQLMSN